ncbi:Transaldolase [Aspergillus sclerotialis]|uniref:Transaldolase n=1 Tax=Aspergillus sclerotialis TaxID=2070753 RepID=A0A3A2Z762_9EURO|nr:Transaldolase [Aspergillus sclerotialis]
MGSEKQAVTWLDSLQDQLKIDIDCMDPAEAKRWLPFQPEDQTSNQHIVYEQMISPVNQQLFLDTAREYKEQGWEAILTRMSALLCAKNIENINGRVLLQSSAFGAYDTEKVVAHARAYAREFESVGISKDRFCIKIPCTGPALNASPILLKEGIRTLGTSLFSLPQAIAASQASVSLSALTSTVCTTSNIFEEFHLISKTVPWFHTDRKQWPDVEDPALEHPMSPRIMQIQETYARLYKETGKVQPMLKPASFISAREAMAMGELGCHHATVPGDVINQLSLLNLESNPPPGHDAPKKTGVPSPRVIHLAKTDPLAGPGWDGKLAFTDVDYLANNGAALDQAINDDPITKRGLHEALEGFKTNELQSKNAIEEVLKQI